MGRVGVLMCVWYAGVLEGLNVGVLRSMNVCGMWECWGVNMCAGVEVLMCVYNIQGC